MWLTAAAAYENSFEATLCLSCPCAIAHTSEFLGLCTLRRSIGFPVARAAGSGQWPADPLGGSIGMAGDLELSLPPLLSAVRREQEFPSSPPYGVQIGGIYNGSVFSKPRLRYRWKERLEQSRGGWDGGSWDSRIGQ